MNENVIKMARLMVGCKYRTCEDCLHLSKKLFGDNKCALIEYAEILDKAGYRKQCETVKEFAEKIAPLMNAMRLIDADALLSDIERTIEESGCVNHEGEIVDCVRYAPTVDIAQVCRLELAEQYGKEE